ncbi:SH3 domain-containing protein [Formosa sediminum]|uniref:SH3 domain-containing protein n=1 Tax=Formosa sediminum TaxID=2594004 RepID=A0A516GQY6_9FLAO|nr:SH3 domain-containing protein [Formosa sediminum]QDO93903.1 SH3 domain-containing protein [Formosa sediminum]
MNKLTCIFLFMSCLIYSQDIDYNNTYSDLENGKEYYLFGNDVAFRTDPDTKSKTIDLIKIGSKIQIIEKSENTVLYNGLPSNYYKVKYNEQIGYVLGGLISLGKKEMGASTYFYTYGKKNDTYYIIIRHVNDKQEITEATTDLKTNDFALEVYDNKGIQGIDNIIFVNYLAEACGVEGGGVYFFEVDGSMTKVFNISQMSNAGIYWYFETLIFPNDKDGIDGKIVYKKESGTYQDEATNWVEINTVSRELEWKNGEILPKLDTEF